MNPNNPFQSQGNPFFPSESNSNATGNNAFANLAAPVMPFNNPQVPNSNPFSNAGNARMPFGNAAAPVNDPFSTPLNLPNNSDPFDTAPAHPNDPFAAPSVQPLMPNTSTFPFGQAGSNQTSASPFPGPTNPPMQPFAPRPVSNSDALSDPFAPRQTKPVEPGNPFQSRASSSRAPPSGSAFIGHSNSLANSFKKPSHPVKPIVQKDPFQALSKAPATNDPFQPAAKTRAVNNPFAVSMSRRAPSKKPFKGPVNHSTPGDPFQAPANQLVSKDPFHAPAAPPWPRDNTAHSRDTNSSRDTPQRNALFLKGVPDDLFDEEEMTNFFTMANPPCHVTNVSLRGKGDAHRRTAVITFSSESDAARSLEQCKNFNGASLSLSFFRSNSARVERERPVPTVEQSNELVFTAIPDALFTESKIRHLFNSVVPNSVTDVSTRSRNFGGEVRRTAIVKFKDMDSASTTLNSLPSKYEDDILKIHFRQRPAHVKPPVPSLEAQGPHGAFAHNAVPQGREREQADFPPFVSSFPETYTSDEQLQSINDADMYADDFYEPSHAHEEDGPYDVVSTYVPEQPATRTSDDKAKTEEKLREMDELRRRIQEKEEERARRKLQKEEINERKRLQKSRQRASESQKMKNVSGLSEQLDKEWRKHEKFNIEDAVAPVGICQEMCSETEIRDRIIQKAFDSLEKTNGEPDPLKAVKKYSRSSAGDTKQIPSELRPPIVLLRTMEHLKRICDSDTDYKHIYDFVRDRARALRQDIACQHIRDDIAIKIIEECSRFLIHSAHSLCELPEEQFTSKQNLEQIDNCLLTLRQMYDDRRECRLPTSPNEPEMQAYYLLVHMSESRKCMELYSLFAPDVQRSEPVQFAFKVCQAASDLLQNPGLFFNSVRRAPYLAACIMHMRFTHFRVCALHLMNETHGAPKQEDKIPISFLTDRYCFEDDDEASRFCELLGFQVVEAMGTNSFEGPKEAPVHIRTPCPTVKSGKVKWKPCRSVTIIESKWVDLKLSQVVSGEGGVTWGIQKLDKSPAVEDGPKDKKTFYPRMVSRQAWTRFLAGGTPPKSPRAPPSMRKKPSTTNVVPVAVVAAVHQPATLATDLNQIITGSSKTVSSFEKVDESNALKKRQFPDALSFPSDCRTALNGSHVFPAAPSPVKNKQEKQVEPPPSTPDPLSKTPEISPVAPLGLFAKPSPAIVATGTSPQKHGLTLGFPAKPALGENERKPGEVIKKDDGGDADKDGVGGTLLKNTLAQGISSFVPPQSLLPGHDVSAEKSEAQSRHKTQASFASIDNAPQSLLGSYPTNDDIPNSVHVLEPTAEQSILSDNPVVANPKETISISEAALDDKVSPSFQEPFKAAEAAEEPKPKTTYEKDREQVIEFITELDHCLDSSEALLNDMRCRRRMTESLYAAEYKECVNALEMLKTVVDVTEEARKKAYETDCARQWVESDLTTLTSSAMVPLLRRASLLWDDIWAFMYQAESQLRRVQLHVSRKRVRAVDGAEAELQYSFEIERKNEKPARLTEIDEASRRVAREFGVGKRARPVVLSELTDVSCRLLDKNIRRWQAAVLPLTGVKSDSNRWVQKRLRGWWDSDGGAFKVLELQDSRIDRYVSIVSCGEDQDVPQTANVVVASIDVGCDTQEIVRSLKALEDAMRLVKKKAAPLNLAIPVVVVVAVEQRHCDTACFHQEVEKVGKALVREGSASMVKVVKPEKSVVQKVEMDETLRDALIASVDLVSMWECSEELTVEATTLREEMLSRASFAWKEILVYSRSFDNLNERNWEFIEAINESWDVLARDMLAQEYRWPVEVTRRREEIRKQRNLVEQHGKLPTPWQPGVQNTSDYIGLLAEEAGMKTPEIDYGSAMHPLWQFCLALEKVLPQLLKARFGDTFDETLLLPREKWTEEGFKKKQEIQRRFLKSDRMRVGVLLPPNRSELKRRLSSAIGEGHTWGSGGIDPTEKRRRLSSDDQFLPRGSASDGSFSMATGKKRRMSYSMYDALVREEEAYARVLDATVEEMRARATKKLRHSR